MLQQGSGFKKNDRIWVTVSRWGDKGMGVGDVAGVPVLIPGTVPGDRVYSHIVKRTKSLAFGKVVSIDQNSPDRVRPPCPISGPCGGCQLQHCTVDAQHRYKQDRVQALLDEYGVSVSAFHGSPDALHYRNHARYVVTQSEGETRIGLSASRSQRIVDCELCWIQHPLANRVLSSVRAFFKRQDMPVFSEAESRDGVFGLRIRVGVYTQDVMVALLSSTETLPYLDRFVSDLQDISELKSVVLNVNRSPEWTGLGRDTRVLWGASYITETIGGISSRLSLGSFFQSNSGLIETMWDRVVALLSLAGSERLWDLYCGTGAMTLALSRHVKETVGVEENAEAIADARENAVRHGVEGVSFICESVDVFLSETSRECDVVVVDPPRTGLSRVVVQALLKKLPKKMVYISCSPPTLGRDLALLCKGGTGYQIDRVECLDFFVHTYHVETLVVLSRL